MQIVRGIRVFCLQMFHGDTQWQWQVEFEWIVLLMQRNPIFYLDECESRQPDKRKQFHFTSAKEIHFISIHLFHHTDTLSLQMNWQWVIPQKPLSAYLSLSLTLALSLSLSAQCATFEESYHLNAYQTKDVVLCMRQMAFGYDYFQFRPKFPVDLISVLHIIQQSKYIIVFFSP